MLDLILVLLFVGLPVAAFVVTRSLAWVSVALALGFGIAGNAVQSLIAVGVQVNVRGLQAAVVFVLALVLVLGFLRARSTMALHRQVLLLIVPAVLIGLFLISMRLAAPGDPGPLTAVGYLVNHPQAEDNAKWLHLAAQLADGRAIEFNGYAGGPLLLVMSMMSALIAVLSTLLLGGVNQVAVAVNTVVGTQFLLIALVPFALAPLVTSRFSMRGGRRRQLPAPAVLVSMLVLLIASAVVTSYGHLSLQFVLLVLVLWSGTFLGDYAVRGRLAMTLAIVCTASVWVPFNVLGLVLLVTCIVWVARRRDWIGLGICVLTGVAVWDALFSSLLFMLGLDVSDDAVGSASSDEGGGSSVIDAQIGNARSLFSAPGGVEQIEPLVAGLALASVLFCVWLVWRQGPGRWAAYLPFLPIAVLGGYLVVVQVGDAITTGGAPHYGGHKLAFAFVVMALVSTLPIAIAGLDGPSPAMRPVRWFAVGSVVILLTVDTILPRAVSALSPILWPSVDASAPAYWSAAEVRPVGDQPISSLPIACVFAPPVSDTPTALPLGQEAYTCTRLMLGMNGLEGKPTVLAHWLMTDWMSQKANWAEFYPVIEEEMALLGGRTVILMSPNGSVAGLTTIDSLLQQNPATTP